MMYCDGSSHRGKRANLLLFASEVRWYQEISSNNEKYQQIDLTLCRYTQQVGHPIRFFGDALGSLPGRRRCTTVEQEQSYAAHRGRGPCAVHQWHFWGSQGELMMDFREFGWGNFNYCKRCGVLKKMYPKMEFGEIWRFKLCHSLRNQSNYQIISQKRSIHRQIPKLSILVIFSQSKWSLIAEVISLSRGVFRLQLDFKVMVG